MTSTTLDRELVSEYSVTLVCRDLGRPSLSTFVQLTVIVTDVNDNSPVFLTDRDLAVNSRGSSSYVAEIFENNFIGALVTQVTRQQYHLDDPYIRVTG